MRKSALILVCLTALLVFVSPGYAVSTVILTGPQAQTANYLTPHVFAQVGDPIEYKNYDILTHDVVSVATDASTTRSWCQNFTQGHCPLFWTPTIGLMGTVIVQGTQNLALSGNYDFYCTLHPAMRGTLHILPI